MKNTEAPKTRIVCKYQGCRKNAAGAVDGTPYCQIHGEAIAESSRRVAWSRHSHFIALTTDELMQGWAK